MRCNVCGADNLEGAVYCEDCGARLPMAAAAVTQEAPVPVAVSAPAPAPAPAPVSYSEPAPAPTPVVAAPIPPAPVEAPPVSSGNIICPACGASNLPGVAFCEDCGASLSDAPTNSSPAVAPPVHYDAPTPVAAPPQPVVVAARARLVLTSGAREFALDKDTILLGRRSPVDGIFPEVDLTDYDTDSYISRRHGRITRKDEGFVYEDLGSSNGSWVNGNKVQPSIQQPLVEGSSLRLGKTEMVVRLS